MKREQLSDRIGNIDEKLVQQAENAPNFGQIQRRRNIRRIVSIAAVLVLIVASFATGAIAMAKETIVYIDSEPKIVYVEKEQEIIVVGSSGISLILPDSWNGKYGYEIDGDAVAVYHLATHESPDPYSGYLFWVTRVDGMYPMDYVFPEPGFTIAVMDDCTYRFIRASDVQVDWSIPELRDGYIELENDVMNIEIAMTADVLKNSINSSNWIQGTVSVSFLENWAITRTITLDVEQSRIVGKIINSQNYQYPAESNISQEILSKPPNILITFDRKEYSVNTITGLVSSMSGLVALISIEDLNIIISFIS